MRREMELRGSFFDAVDVVAEFFAVVHGCDVIPRAKWMPRRAVHQRLALRPGLVVAVEEPRVTRDANLEQHPVVGVGAGHRILFAEMKPALLALAAVGTEDG